MSFFRAKNRALNKNVFFDQRVYGFLKSPIRTGNLYVENNENVNKDLTVGGNMTIAKDLNVGGNLTVGKDLFVKGSQTIDGDLDVSGNQTIGGDLDVSGNQTIDSNLHVKGDQTIGGDLDVSGNQMIGGDLDVSGNQTIGGDLDVSGNQTIDGDLEVKGDVSATDVYATGNFYLDTYLLIPYGTIIQSAAVSVPSGWLLCNGDSVAVATYPKLFDAILYKYGGSGLNFNVPDLRGRVAVGSGQGSALTNRALASKGGDETHTLSVGEMPSHAHNSNAIGGTIGLIIADGNNTATITDSTAIEPNVYTAPQALTINETGGGQPHNNMQPFLVLNYLIKY
jgi:microcystin-dependent protein/cytoskeletal protein CcmA (bactofilin family)